MLLLYIWTFKGNDHVGSKLHAKPLLPKVNGLTHGQMLGAQIELLLQGYQIILQCLDGPEVQIGCMAESVWAGEGAVWWNNPNMISQLATNIFSGIQNK